MLCATVGLAHKVYCSGSSLVSNHNVALVSAQDNTFLALIGQWFARQIGELLNACSVNELNAGNTNAPEVN